MTSYNRKNRRLSTTSSSTIRRRESNKVNELYYARDNNPNFYQFSEYHFRDREGRLYKIADYNQQSSPVLNNNRFTVNKERGKSRYQTSPLMRFDTTNNNNFKENRRRQCYVSSDGYIKMFVKLPNSSVRWFNASSIDKLISTREGKSKDGVVFKLRQAFRYNEKRRTGTIYVSGLNKTYCNNLLNDD